MVVVQLEDALALTDIATTLEICGEVDQVPETLDRGGERSIGIEPGAA